MRLYDTVRLTADRPEYAKYGVHAGDIGTIVSETINFLGTKVGCFEVMFFPETPNKDVYVSVDVCDLEVVTELHYPDEGILEGLPYHDPSRWCIVENGYIMNLKGEKLNRIPYQYDTWGDEDK